MGSSHSQFKRNRSQYSSARSVAFSLPSNWDRHSYAYGDSRHHRSSSDNISTISTPPKPILRKRTASNAGDNRLATRVSLNSDRLSRSMHSLHSSDYEQNRRPSAYSEGQGQLSHSQYSDIYLKNDLKRVFRAQDRSASVANVNGNVYHEDGSANELDHRLMVLKAQRHSTIPGRTEQEDRKEGATEKRIKSKKSRKAPTPSRGSAYGDSQRSSRVEGLYRKKGPAPQPPLKQRAQSLTSLVERNNSDFSRSLSQENEHESESYNSMITSTVESNIEIPRPDYDGQQPEKKGVLVMPQPTGVKLKKVKNSAPPVPKKPGVTKKDSETATKCEMSTQSEVVDVEIHHEPAILEPSASKVARPPTPPMVPVKKEMREIAIQYDAPVEIAIQCSGNTLKVKSEPTSSDSTSLAELLQMFNEAIKAGNISSPSKTDATTEEKEDSVSLSSKGSSCDRNSTQQKVVPMHQVLASVPEPPPPPDFGIKFIQKRTIKDNAPISLAPGALQLEKTITNPADTPPRNHMTFQQQLITAYEKIEQKRRSNPTIPNSSADSESCDSHPLGEFRYSDTILGVQTPLENESDSGHDEPSESQSDQTASIPDFVLAGIVRGIHSEPAEETSSQHEPAKVVEKKEKSKFNSIRRLKNSVRSLVLPKRHNLAEDNISESEFTENHFDGNWTFSGRTRSSRVAMSMQDFPPQESIECEGEISPPSLSSTGVKSPSHFKQTNMKSFSLLTPLGYSGSTPKQQQTTSNQRGPPVPQVHSLADVPL